MVVSPVKIERPMGKFSVNCNAPGAGSLAVLGDRITVSIGQLIEVNEAVELYETVTIVSVLEEDGGIGLRVVVHHPKWENAMQIAYLRSKLRGSPSDQATVEFDFNREIL
jgi:hypothetical protein